MTGKTIQTASPEFIAIFRQEAGDGGPMPFARFMDLALYHPETGYYARRRRRVGRAPDTDFFTATSLGPVFGELVVAACVSLLGPQPPGAYTLVDIGAEPGGPGPDAPGGVLAGATHPFAGSVGIQLGQPLAFPQRSVVFSNELFDAQPFHRLIREAGHWRETGVTLRHDTLEEVLLPEFSPEVRTVEDRLPPVAPDGYRIDLPLAAARLAAQIAAQPWTGLFVAFDYGKSWRELTEDTPDGTLRAYFRHRQGRDLLARAGGQDLTGHVCWDWLAETLVRHGFTAPVLESQEAFFVHHAAPALSRLTTAEAGHFSGRKLGVMQLLHPANMGRKFQVLHALRDSIP